MWKLIFDSTTNRGVATNRDAQEGEFMRELPPSQCAWFMSEPNRYRWDVPTLKIVEVETWAEEKAVEAAAAAKVEAEKAIRAKYQAQLDQLGSPYWQGERETWKTQEEEAVQWLADNTAPCVMIRGMATTRGITMELMVEKIMENTVLFKQYAGIILGNQQKELDELEAV